MWQLRHIIMMHFGNGDKLNRVGFEGRLILWAGRLSCCPTNSWCSGDVNTALCISVSNCTYMFVCFTFVCSVMTASWQLGRSSVVSASVSRRNLLYSFCFVQVGCIKCTPVQRVSNCQCPLVLYWEWLCTKSWPDDVRTVSSYKFVCCTRIYHHCID